MKVKGRLIGWMPDLLKKKTVVQLEISEVSDCTSLQDKDLSIELKKYSEKRTLTANSYYWVLIGKMAGKMNVSNAYMHNLMLRRYGTVMDTDGRLWEAWLPEEIEDSKVMEDEVNHLKITSETFGGRRKYFFIKGSSQYDKAEMARLIDGTVEDAKALGIETESPEYIERMMTLYERSV